MTIQIETNHAIGNEVYFIKDDKIKSGTIYKMEMTITADSQDVLLYVRSESNDINCISDSRAYQSKEQLIQSL